MKKLFKILSGFWFPVVFFAACLSNMVGKMYYNNYNWMDVSMFIAAIALTGMILKDIKRVDVPTTVEPNIDELNKYGIDLPNEKDDDGYFGVTYDNVLVSEKSFSLNNHPFKSGDVNTLYDCDKNKLEMTDYENDLSNGVSRLVQKCYTASYLAGWHTDPHSGQLLDRNKAEMLCLIHSEISEAMEGERKGLMDDHLPNRPMAEVELADAVIRIADYCGRWKYDLGGAIVDKLRYNANRADHKPENRVKEGGKKF